MPANSLSAARQDNNLLYWSSFGWKKASTPLAEAMRDLLDEYWLYIVGGMETDRQALQHYR